MIVFLVASLASIVGALDVRLDRVPVGTWSEYQVSGMGVPLFVRIASVGEEPGGRWIELWISQRPGSASQVYRALVAAGPGGATEVRRLLARWAGGAVRELAPGSLVGPAPEGSRTCENRCGTPPRERTRRLGRIETPAGAFDAVERIAGSGASRLRIVAAEKLPFGGLLRLELGRLRIELTGTGKDAQSAIPPDAQVVPLAAGAP